LNILDENIPKEVQKLLAAWHIHTRQIGHEVGRSGMKDDQIVSLLQQQSPSTFYTLDQDYFRRSLCHHNYCLVFFDVEVENLAQAIRDFARHPRFSTEAKRLGKVVQATNENIDVWTLGGQQLERFQWPSRGRRA
jgi:hypothetical protein